MDIEKLIEQLRWWADNCDRTNYGCQARPFLLDAATAISTLQAENEKLRAELERVKRERDAAVASWRGFCAKCAWNGKQYLADGKMDDRCKTCRENGKCNWQWRGQKEDGNG